MLMPVPDHKHRPDRLCGEGELAWDELLGTWPSLGLGKQQVKPQPKARPNRRHGKPLSGRFGNRARSAGFG